MAALAEALGAPVAPVESVGWDGDVLEAQAFAYLAVRSLADCLSASPRRRAWPGRPAAAASTRRLSSPELDYFAAALVLPLAGAGSTRVR